MFARFYLARTLGPSAPKGPRHDTIAGLFGGIMQACRSKTRTRGESVKKRRPPDDSLLAVFLQTVPQGCMNQV